jgi:hypothetical protein
VTAPLTAAEQSKDALVATLNARGVDATDLRTCGIPPGSGVGCMVLHEKPCPACAPAANADSPADSARWTGAGDSECPHEWLRHSCRANAVHWRCATCYAERVAVLHDCTPAAKPEPAADKAEGPDVMVYFNGGLPHSVRLIDPVSSHEPHAVGLPFVPASKLAAVERELAEANHLLHRYRVALAKAEGKGASETDLLAEGLDLNAKAEPAAEETSGSGYRPPDLPWTYDGPFASFDEAKAHWDKIHPNWQEGCVVTKCGECGEYKRATAPAAPGQR